MTETEAREWLRARFGVSRETRLAEFVDLVREEAARQNLVSASSLDSIWSRHVVDSAQLVPLAPDDGGWVDIGTGAGFPGLVVGLLRDAPMILIEPRARRAEFLSATATRLGADNISVIHAKVEATSGVAAVISARAVAMLGRLFHGASGWAGPGTIWLLPRGRSGREELAVTRKTWHGSFHVEQSLTSPDSVVVVASGVRRR